MSLNSWSESEQEAIRGQLDRMLKSGPFLQSRRRQRFLEYIVNEALAGRGERLKGYTIALAVFDRPETFDPAVDPVVRVEAARLRDKLREYYEADGHDDAVRIDLPKGSYTPHIEFRQSVAPSHQPDGRVETTVSETHPRKTLARSLATAIIAMLLVLLAGFSVWRWWGASTSSSERASIAVLPFENIGSDPKWERYADGDHRGHRYRPVALQGPVRRRPKFY
jgi:hypothetical protein